MAITLVPTDTSLFARSHRKRMRSTPESETAPESTGRETCQVVVPIFPRCRTSPILNGLVRRRCRTAGVRRILDSKPSTTNTKPEPVVEGLCFSCSTGPAEGRRAATNRSRKVRWLRVQRGVSDVPARRVGTWREPCVHVHVSSSGFVALPALLKKVFRRFFEKCRVLSSCARRRVRRGA